jgi:hypothetical protein
MDVVYLSFLAAEILARHPGDQEPLRLSATSQFTIRTSETGMLSMRQAIFLAPERCSVLFLLEIMARTEFELQVFLRPPPKLSL